MNRDGPQIRHRWARALSWLKGRILTGLIVIVPIGATVWLCLTAIQWVDGLVLAWVPAEYQPARVLGRAVGSDLKLPIPGLGVVVFLVGTTLVGTVAKGPIGRTVIGVTEKAVARTPVVRSVYTAAKQIAETVAAEGRASFQKVCMIEFPRRGLWMLGLVSTPAQGELMLRVPGRSRIVAVFMVTTPNPTSGFLLFVEEDDVRYLDMSIEDGLKLIISAGLVQPPDRTPSLRTETGHTAVSSDPIIARAQPVYSADAPGKRQP